MTRLGTNIKNLTSVMGINIKNLTSVMGTNIKNLTSVMGTNIKNLTSVMKFAAVIFSCLIATFMFYELSSWMTICRSPSDLRKTNVGDTVRIFRRSVKQTQVVDHYQHCIVATPSKEDIKKLCTHQECATLHCARSCHCGDDLCRLSSRTTCLTKACSKFTVNDPESSTVHKDIDLRHLSGIVNDYLSGWRDVKNVEVRCSDFNSHLFDSKLDLEITRDNSKKCNIDQVTDTSSSNESTETNHPNHTSSNIYFIYFRLMSKWESFTKLPKLNSFIEHKRSDTGWDIHTFDKLQSQNFVLEENLRSVLGLSNVSTSSENSTFNKDNFDLIRLAIEKGHCVLFNVLACSKAEIYTEIQRVVIAQNNTRNCQLHKNEHHESRWPTDYTNHTFCDQSLDGIDMEDTLYIHDQVGQIFSTTSSDVFSILVINIPDLTSMNILDSAIVDLVSQIVSQESNVLVLMSDVGDPKFSRFDDSVFLRTQTFNPLLHVFVSRRTNQERPALTQVIADLKYTEHNHLAIGISDLYNLAHKLITKDETESENPIPAESQINNRSGSNNQDEAQSTGACPVENIKGPIECLCQGNHVWFPNDSIQVAFASLIVGSLNNKLLEISDSNDQRLDKVKELSISHSSCDRLLGVSFNNVHHVLWKNYTYVLMTLHLAPTSRGHSHTLRLDAEVEYSTDYNYKSNFTVNILNPTKFSLKELSDSKNDNAKKLVHLLCQEPNDLNQKSTNHREFLASLSSENHFGVTAKIKSVHHPCLFLVTRSYGDSAVLEASNICVDRLYSLSVSAEFINIIPLSVLPVENTIGPREVKFITSLVKSAYWISKSAYKIKTSYTVFDLRSKEPPMFATHF